MRAFLLSLASLAFVGCGSSHSVGEMADAATDAGSDSERDSTVDVADSGVMRSGFLIVAEPAPGRALVVRRERDGTETARLEVRVEEGEHPVGLVPNTNGTSAFLHTHRTEGGLSRGDTYLLQFETGSVSSLHAIALEAGCTDFSLFSRIEWLPSGREFLIDCEDRVLRKAVASDEVAITDALYVGTLPDGRMLALRDESIVFVDATGEPGDVLPLDASRVLVTYTEGGNGFIDFEYVGDVGIGSLRWRNLADTERELLIESRTPYALTYHPSPNGFFFVYHNEDMSTPGVVELWSRAGRARLAAETARCTPVAPDPVPSVTWSQSGTAFLWCVEGAWLIDAAGGSRLASVETRVLSDAVWSPEGDEILLEAFDGSRQWQVFDLVSGGSTELDVPEGTLRVVWSERAWKPECLTAVCW